MMKSGMLVGGTVIGVMITEDEYLPQGIVLISVPGAIAQRLPIDPASWR